MNLKNKLVYISIAIYSAIFPALLGAYTVYSREYDTIAYTVDLDPYYSSFEIYKNLSKEPIACLQENEESRIYQCLWEKAFYPKVALLELSCYPMPMAGVAVKKNFRDAYNRANISEDLNLINVMCAGFQEPAAVSIFLGNIVSFKPKGITRDIKGKAYMGYLASFGSYHIKDSELIEDKWLELEWKIKGDRITDKRIMKWSYRIGTKQHNNPDIKDVLYFSIFRDRIDFKEQEKSIFNNANFEYKMDIDYTNFSAIEHYFLIGKSFPRENSRLVFQLQFGFTWEKKEKYTGSLTRLKEDTLSIMIRPNIKF